MSDDIDRLMEEIGQVLQELQPGKRTVIRGAEHLLVNESAYKRGMKAWEQYQVTGNEADLMAAWKHLLTARYQTISRDERIKRSQQARKSVQQSPQVIRANERLPQIIEILKTATGRSEHQKALCGKELLAEQGISMGLTRIKQLLSKT